MQRCVILLGGELIKSRDKLRLPCFPVPSLGCIELCCIQVEVLQLYGHFSIEKLCPLC